MQWILLIYTVENFQIFGLYIWAREFLRKKVKLRFFQIDNLCARNENGIIFERDLGTKYLIEMR